MGMPRAHVDSTTEADFQSTTQQSATLRYEIRIKITSRIKKNLRGDWLSELEVDAHHECVAMGLFQLEIDVFNFVLL